VVDALIFHCHKATCFIPSLCDFMYIGYLLFKQFSRRFPWFPVADVQIRPQVRLFGIFGGQSGTEAGFLRVRRYHQPLILLTAPHSSSARVADVPDKPSFLIASSLSHFSFVCMHVCIYYGFCVIFLGPFILLSVSPPTVFCRMWTK
jgi:hypothetical protein